MEHIELSQIKHVTFSDSIKIAGETELFKTIFSERACATKGTTMFTRHDPSDNVKAQLSLRGLRTHHPIPKERHPIKPIQNFLNSIILDYVESSEIVISPDQLKEILATSAYFLEKSIDSAEAQLKENKLLKEANTFELLILKDFMEEVEKKRLTKEEMFEFSEFVEVLFPRNISDLLEVAFDDMLDSPKWDHFIKLRLHGDSDLLLV